MINVNKLLDNPEDFASDYYLKIVSVLEKGIIYNPKIKYKILQSAGGTITPIGMRDILSRLAVFFNGDVVKIEINNKIKTIVLDEKIPNFDKIFLVKKGSIREDAEIQSSIFNPLLYKKEVETESIKHFSQFLNHSQSETICKIFNVEKTTNINEFINKANFPVLDVWEVSFLWKMPGLIFSDNYSVDKILENMNEEKKRSKHSCESFLKFLSNY